MMKTIFNAVTGEPKTLDFVDSREHIATGRWLNEKPESVVVQVKEEVKEETQKVIAQDKPKRGRKPKEQ